LVFCRKCIGRRGDDSFFFLICFPGTARGTLYSTHTRLGRETGDNILIKVGTRITNPVQLSNFTEKLLFG
jgi:hypothetical protein